MFNTFLHIIWNEIWHIRNKWFFSNKIIILINFIPGKSQGKPVGISTFDKLLVIFPVNKLFTFVLSANLAKYPVDNDKVRHSYLKQNQNLFTLVKILNILFHTNLNTKLTTIKILGYSYQKMKNE